MFATAFFELFERREILWTVHHEFKTQKTINSAKSEKNTMQSVEP